MHAAGVTVGFGDDHLAGGAGDDLLFGQLGNDVLEGDASIAEALAGRPAGAGRGTVPVGLGDLVVTPFDRGRPPTATTTSRVAAAPTSSSAASARTTSSAAARASSR